MIFEFIFFRIIKIPSLMPSCPACLSELTVNDLQRVRQLLAAALHLDGELPSDEDDSEELYHAQSLSHEQEWSKCAMPSMSHSIPPPLFQSNPTISAQIQSLIPTLPPQAIQLSDTPNGAPGIPDTVSSEQKSPGVPLQYQPPIYPPYSAADASMSQQQHYLQSMKSSKIPESNGKPSRGSRTGTSLSLQQLLSQPKNGLISNQ